MSYTHRHGAELHALDQRYTRTAGKMKPCHRVTLFIDGQAQPGRVVVETIETATACGDFFVSHDSERRSYQIDEVWA